LSLLRPHPNEGARLSSGIIVTFPRRQFLHLAAGALAFPVISQIAIAETYPTRPVRIIVGYPAGLTPDIVVRLIAPPLSEKLRQQVIVDNRPGAGSNIGADAAVRAPADGYTLLIVTFANAINATLYDSLNFDIAHDIAPVVGTFRSPAVIVVAPSFPAKTVPEFIAYAKANPGKINYASAGYGTVNHVAAEMFNTMAGINLVHVPYRGSYIPDLLAGQVHLAITPIATTIEYIKAGELRALAVTGATPCDALPDVPSLAEFVPGYEANVWHGIGAPKHTPSAIIAKLNKEVNAVLADSQMKERFAKLGGTVLGGSPDDFGKLVAKEIEKWSKVIDVADKRPH
jgi:tripartite-type tricarboxylate transporter receptor subunit TctC